MVWYRFKEMVKYLLITICFLITGCTTVATRENGETLKIRGTGKAVWADGSSIEGKPMIEFPPINYEQ